MVYIMTKTQKQIQSEQTRSFIIETAAKLFTQKGFYGTSMADLASATGLTKGAFYHHFESKDTLFFAVIDFVQEKWQKAVAQEVIQPHHSIERLTILLENHAELLRKEPTLCLVISGLIAEMEGNDARFFAALQEVYTEMILFVEKIIRTGQSKGEIRNDVDAHLIAINIVGLLRGVSCFSVLGKMGLDCEIVINALKPVLLDGLCLKDNKWKE
jgi:TetR/AcrR family transcriptional repressor of nem operon